MLSQALTASTDIYKENGRILGLIEDKAQKVAVLAGVFLAAAFGFLRKDALGDLAHLLGGFGLGILASIVALMLLSVVTVAWTLWVRQMSMPPDPTSILQNVDLRLGLEGGPTDEMQENDLREQARVWNEGVQSQRAAIDGKAKLLIVAQALLLAGICLVFALLSLTIFKYETAINGPNATCPASSALKETPHVQEMPQRR